MNQKILHLRSSAGLYGAEQVILNLARALNRLGCTNHIVCIDNARNSHIELVEEARKMNLSASAIECRSLFDHQTVMRIRELLSREQIDVIHSHDYKSGVFALCAAAGLGLKRVATNHLWTRSSMKLRVYETLEGVLYNCFDNVVAVSELIEKECRPFLLNRNKLTCIPNGIDVGRFPLQTCEPERRSIRAQLGVQEGDLVIGNIARLSVEKDQAMLLRAFKRLTALSAPRSLKLLIAGDGPEAGNLRSLAHELGLHEHCLFLGFREDIPQILDSLDIYVQSSKREGLPIVLLEAMAAGKAIVSTKAGGIPGVIEDGKQGCLVEIGDVEQLAHVLDRVVKSADERRELGRQARHLVEAKFSAGTMAEKYLAVYRG